MLISTYSVTLGYFGPWSNVSLGLKYQRNDSAVRRFLLACGLRPLLLEVQNETEIAAGRLFTSQNRKIYLITTQAKRNLSSRSGIGGVRSAT